MKRLYSLVVLSLLFFKLSGQETQSAKEMMLEAESDFLYEDFNEALPLYLKLLKADPSNDNLNFKIGVCYLNIPYEKDKSIIYLEKAIKNINPNYKVDNINEKQAPPDALFYLGNAYRINNRLEDALKEYNEFKEKLDPAVFDENLVNDQINAIDRAKKLENNPVFFDYQNLGPDINSRFSESNAVVSANDSVLVYNVKLQFYDALFFSTKMANGEWGAPVNIIPDLGVDGDVYSTSLSADGKELYIYRSDNFDGNLYVSHYLNNKWSPIKKLNDNINTKYWESHASISNDGLTLYFTSNRKGGYGGLDIYKATRTSVKNDDWANVENLGPDINTPYNEETPFISKDGKTLFFSSYGHYNMGGYDIFYSNLLENGKWSVPLNMGYPINTTDDDIFFSPVLDGSFAYVCRYFPKSNYGKTDIYRIEIYSKQHPRKFLLKGLVRLPSEFKNDKSLQLTAQLINLTTHDTSKLIGIDPLSARFDTKIMAGNYQLIIEGKGMEKSVEEFSVKNNQPDNEVSISAALKALPIEPVQSVKVEPLKKLTSADVFEQTFFKVYNNNKLFIKLNLPEGTKVTVDIFADTTFSKKDNILITKLNSQYSFIPVLGKNVLKFSAICPDAQIVKGDVIVIYEQLADTISEKELARKLAEQQRDLLYAKNILGYLSKGKLREVINKTDIFKENLTSLEELKTYLKNKAQFSNYRISDVESLFTKFYLLQPISAQLLANALKFLLPDPIKPLLVSLINANPNLTVADITKFLIRHSLDSDATKLNLLAATLRLADAGSAYYYLMALRKVASGNFKNLLDTLDLNKVNINSPEELLEYLLSQAPKAGYKPNDVFKAFLLIPAFTNSPVVLLNKLIESSTGDLKEFLKHISINEKQVKTTSDLGNLLYDRALVARISLKDLVDLLIKVNSEYYLKQLIDDLNNFSSGTLKDILDNINLKNENINSPGELINFILSRSDDKEIYNELMSVLSYIASKNLLKAENFKSKFEQWFQFTPINIGLISLFFILLAVVLFFAFRRNKRGNGLFLE